MNNILSPKEAMRIEDEIIVEILKLRELISNAYSATENYPFPSMDNLRKATERDMVFGNVIWYPKDEYGDGYWKIISEVLHPDDMWKAYTATDGSRYGLENAYIEIGD